MFNDKSSSIDAKTMIQYHEELDRYLIMMDVISTFHIRLCTALKECR